MPVLTDALNYMAGKVEDFLLLNNGSGYYLAGINSSGTRITDEVPATFKAASNGIKQLQSNVVLQAISNGTITKLQVATMGFSGSYRPAITIDLPSSVTVVKDQYITILKDVTYFSLANA